MFLAAVYSVLYKYHSSIYFELVGLLHSIDHSNSEFITAGFDSLRRCRISFDVKCLPARILASREYNPLILATGT